MSKTKKIILFASIAVFTGFFSLYIFGFLIFGHSINIQTYKQYMWVFKDSIKKDIDTFLCTSRVRNRDIYNTFKYKEYNIHVWEFKDLSTVDLDEIKINQNVKIKIKEYRYEEVFNPKGSLQVHIKYLFDFNGNIEVNLDQDSKIEKNILFPKYRGFYGTINKMSLSNENKEDGIIFDYARGKKPSVLLLYKGHGSFYIILVNSDIPFDENIVNIFNLD